MNATRDTLGALGTAAATVVAWWAWLGWDTEYEIDPVTLAPVPLTLPPVADQS